MWETGALAGRFVGALATACLDGVLRTGSALGGTPVAFLSVEGLITSEPFLDGVAAVGRRTTPGNPFLCVLTDGGLGAVVDVGALRFAWGVWGWGLE